MNCPNALHQHEKKWKGKLILKMFACRKVKVNPDTDEQPHISCKVYKDKTKDKDPLF